MNGSVDSSSSTSVRFEEEELARPSSSTQIRAAGIISWVMSHSGGSLKNEKQASIAIIVFVVLALCFSAFLLFGGSQTPTKAPVILIEMMPVNQ